MTLVLGRHVAELRLILVRKPVVYDSWLLSESAVLMRLAEHPFGTRCPSSGNTRLGSSGLALTF